MELDLVNELQAKTRQLEREHGEAQEGDAYDII